MMSILQVTKQWQDGHAPASFDILPFDVGNESVKELFKIALQQVFFITIMSIKSGAADICSINHILDGDLVIVLFENQFDERLAQRAPRATGPTIIFLIARRHDLHLQTMIVSLS